LAQFKGSKNINKSTDNKHKNALFALVRRLVYSFILHFLVSFVIRSQQTAGKRSQQTDL